ncbi:hypothetical protein F8388_002175, partial [Cannabis sativa]
SVAFEDVFVESESEFQTLPAVVVLSPTTIGVQRLPLHPPYRDHENCLLHKIISIGLSKLIRNWGQLYELSVMTVMSFSTTTTISSIATTNVSPQLWQATNGILMTNDVADTNPEEAVHYFALSNNDSYVMSTSAGKISLSNMMTFKTMTTFMPPPCVATFLALHPQDNNIIAIGMDDSTIQIYNVRVDD